MNDTALMVRLLGRLKKEMNGAVTEAMRDRGLDYPLNYGVSVPTIQDIAREYGPRHSLALLLFRQQVRELKIAATFIDDPAEVAADQMRSWANDFTTTELVEQVVYNLFRKAPDAELLAGEWLGATDPLRLYAGLLLAASAISPEMEPHRLRWYFERTDRLVLQQEGGAFIVRGLVMTLRRLAAVSPQLRSELQRRLAVYKTAPNSLAHQVAEELEWQLEYLDPAT